MLEQFDLSGRVAIVTGCSDGLGQGMACGLAEAGVDIIGVDYADFSKTRAMIERTGRIFIGIRADLSSIVPIEGVIEKTIETFGKLNILVNNAGITRRADAIHVTENDWDDVINVNLKSVFFFCQAAAKQFIKQGRGGKIINIASMLSFQGGLNVSAYTASKSGIMGLTRLLANEWAPYNINVNAIAPGYMATRLNDPLIKDPKRNKEILSRIPAGRWGSPDDLKGAVVFLASDASNYVHGYTVAVDGGWLAR